MSVELQEQSSLVLLKLSKQDSSPQTRVLTQLSKLGNWRKNQAAMSMLPVQVPVKPIFPDPTRCPMLCTDQLLAHSTHSVFSCSTPTGVTLDPATPSFTPLSHNLVDLFKASCQPSVIEPKPEQSTLAKLLWSTLEYPPWEFGHVSSMLITLSLGNP